MKLNLVEAEEDVYCIFRILWWVRQDLNLWPLPCRGSGKCLLHKHWQQISGIFFLSNRLQTDVYHSVVTALW